MTVKQLMDIFTSYNIPEDVNIVSDSKWECSETEIHGIYYSKEENLLVLVQQINEDDTWNVDYWKERYSRYKKEKYAWESDGKEKYYEEKIKRFNNFIAIHVE